MKTARFETLSVETVEESLQKLLAVAADQSDEYWTRDNFLRDLPGKWDLSFAVFLNSDLVGYAVLSNKDSRTVHLHHFMLRSDCRGEGLGGLMLAEVEARSRRAGAKVLSLKYRADNDRVRAFYERAGFGVVGQNAPYRHMAKILVPAG
ncbi:GNAT family N-acetyltransferase [Desulfocurvus sp. DL9XJH121]